MGATARGKKRRKNQTNKITNYFGNPLGLKEDQLEQKGNLQNLTEDSFNLSVKTYRPANIPVFDKGFVIQI